MSFPALRLTSPAVTDLHRTARMPAIRRAARDHVGSVRPVRQAVLALGRVAAIGLSAAVYLGVIAAMFWV